MDIMDSEKLDRFIRKPELLELTGYSNPTINKLIRAGTFPKPIRLNGGRSVAWRQRDLIAWQQSREEV